MPVFLLTVLLLLPATGMAADVLISNANGYIDSENRFDWMSISDGRITATGSGQPPSIDAATVVDMAGKTIIPGLIDAHGHVSSLGEAKLTVDLVGTGSLQDALNRVAAQLPPGDGWVQGRGWNQVFWPGKNYPRAEDLDRVVSNRPVWLTRIDGHAGWANSAAIELAGINNQTEDPTGGKIIRDQQGRATGIFVDYAMALIEDNIPPPDTTRIRYALELAQKRLNSLGITSVHDAGVDSETLDVYKAMADDQDLTVRIYAMISGAGENLDALVNPLISYGRGRLTARSVKLYIDGALGSRGAAMLEDYSDDPGNKGLVFLKQEELNRQVAKAMRMGFQVNIHAIGDQGNRMALDAFAAAQAGQAGDYRNRIEHSQVVVPDDIPRFAALNIIASMQPVHATSDKNMAEDRIGKKRLAGAYAWRSFLDQGTVIAAGSDFPVEYANPFFGIYAAVTRQDQQGNPVGGWIPQQAMTLAETFRAFTTDAAYAAFQEADLGSLQIGKWADFVVLDRDMFNVDEAELWQVQVEQTWLAGEAVFVRH